jgi:SAM-dependent methyltransferase
MTDDQPSAPDRPAPALPADALAINRAAWDRVAPRFFGGTALPSYGPLAPTEETLRLLDARAGMRVLELGCGSGHSLRYLAERGAAELWGLDLSATQLAFAADVLRAFGDRVRLVESPMEVNPGIPTGYFDLVLSVYGLGWTTDLPATLALVEAYLKPGGWLVFSGEHPAYGCLEYADGRYVVVRPYTAEGPDVHESWNGARVVIQRRTLSTFVNEVVRAGLRVETLVEGECVATPESLTDPARWYSVPRARLVPTTFVLKARKPAAPDPR